MEGIQSVINMVTPNCFMASIDIKDAYYSVPIAHEYRKCLRFQYTCFPNGLACCPRLFTKLLKPVYASLRQTGDEIVPYIDDSYIQGDMDQECWQSVKKTAFLLQDLDRTLENEKIDALKQNHGDFDAQMELSASAKSDLEWWIDNIQQSEKKISPPNPDIVITTDASKQGWGGSERPPHYGGSIGGPLLRQRSI